MNTYCTAHSITLCIQYYPQKTSISCEWAKKKSPGKQFEINIRSEVILTALLTCKLSLLRHNIACPTLLYNKNINSLDCWSIYIFMLRPLELRPDAFWVRIQVTFLIFSPQVWKKGMVSFSSWEKMAKKNLQLQNFHSVGGYKTISST